MMVGSVGGVSPLFGNHKAAAPSSDASTPAFGAGLQAGANPSFSTNSAIRSAGNNLLGTTQGKQAEFSQYQGASSNARTATVNIDSSKASKETISSMASSPMNLDVKQTALAQTNAGQAVGMSERGVDAGEYAFSIETGGKTHTFSIAVGENDTNESIQEKMAALINKADIGITASVTAGAEDGTRSLSLASDSTGTDAAFTVSDDSGNLASAMGITEATQEAQNAVYSINGGPEKESQSNTVTLAEGVTATLKGSGTASVSAERDTKSAMAAATNLVNALNSALKSANSGDGRGSARLASDIQTLTKTYASQLASAGITVSRNGELTIDEAKLEKAAQNGSLDRLFTNERTGFSARAERIANNAANTEKYADMQLGFSFERGQFKFFNIQNAGMLFNMLI